MNWSNKLSRAIRRLEAMPKCYIVIAIVGFALLATIAYPFLFWDKYDAVDNMKDFFGRYCDLTKPVFDASNLPWAQELRANAKAIHEEFLNFEKTHFVPRISSVTSTERKLDYNASHAWRSVFLRVYGKNTNHIDQFPLTAKLVAKIPHDVSMIMFSILDPHYVGKDHNGIHRGVLRYLMGLEVPHPDLCPLHILGKPYYYAEGQDIYFDDTVEHRVDNMSDKRRVSLFLDVRRDFGHFLPNLVNSVGMFIARHLPQVDEAVTNANNLSPNVNAG